MLWFKKEKDSRKIFQKYYKNDEASLQKCILLLKKAGRSQMESVKILIDELNIPLTEADHIILNARAWSKAKAANLNLREDFWKVLFESMLEQAFKYTIGELSKAGIKHEVHNFPSGAIMVDIWIGSEFYVIQFQDDLIGISEVTEENPGFTTVPEEAFYNFEAFKARFDEIIRKS